MFFAEIPLSQRRGGGPERLEMLCEDVLGERRQRVTNLGNVHVNSVT